MAASMGREITLANKYFYAFGRRSIHYLSNKGYRYSSRHNRVLDRVLEVSDMTQQYACLNLTAMRNVRKLVPTENDPEPDDFLGIESDIIQHQSGTEIVSSISGEVKQLLKKNDVTMKKFEKVIETNFGCIRRDTDNTVNRNRKRYRPRQNGDKDELDSQVRSMFSLFSDIPDKPVSLSVESSINEDDKFVELLANSSAGIGYQPMTRRERRQKYNELTSLKEKCVSKGTSSQKSTTELYSHNDETGVVDRSSKSTNHENDAELNYFDEDYFGNYLANKTPASNIKPDDQLFSSSETSGPVPLRKSFEADKINNLNYIDSEYFGSYSSDMSEQRPVEEKVTSSTIEATSESVHQEADLPSYFDECFLDSESKYLNSKHRESVKKLHIHQRVTDIEKKDINQVNCRPQTCNTNILSEVHLNDELTQDTDVLPPPVVPRIRPDKSRSDSISVKRIEKTELKQDKGNTDIVMKQKRKPLPVKFNIEQPETAYDVVMKMRLEKAGRVTSEDKVKAAPQIVPAVGERLDSHGFRILKDQVQDWRRIPQHAVTKLLKDSIIFERGDIIALNKPYGLASHGGPGVSASVGQYLSELAKAIDSTGELETLHLIHRLDKETTGVMLLAKSPHMAWRLHQMFLKREVIKKYWVITKGVPNPLQGVIDIPMAEGTVEGKYRMLLKPKSTDDTRLVMNKSNMKTSEAVTHYRVLDSSSSAALVECQPQTGVKHQIRAHLAFGLNTPVLGDHKYSHLTKIAPQRLYPDTLQKLGIRQSKVRTLPMHLHASVLILPEFEDGRNIIISSRLPKHFVRNMQRLKIKPPK